jgi:hypothetical protein
MSPRVHLVASRRSSHNFGTSEISSYATCLLCHVLWPRILQHRHLRLDYPSEAKALICANKVPEKTAMAVKTHLPRLSLAALLTR